MHLHWLDIPHGGITPVGKTKRRMNLRADAWHIQNNILITQDGQACIADFGFSDMFSLYLSLCKLETLRFTAPERLSKPFPSDLDSPASLRLYSPSEKGDIYSIAMTSFSVRSSTVNHSAI